MSVMSARPGSIGAAIPPASWFRTGVIRVDDALSGAARCRHVALCQRGIGAFEVIVVPALVDLQADRIVRIIRLGLSRRRCRSHPNCQNRQSQNAHQTLFSVPSPSTGTGASQLAQQRYSTSVPVRFPWPGHGQPQPAGGDIADAPPWSRGAKRVFTWCGRWDSNPHDVAIEGF